MIVFFEKVCCEARDLYAKDLGGGALERANS